MNWKKRRKRRTQAPASPPEELRSPMEEKIDMLVGVWAAFVCCMVALVLLRDSFALPV